MLIILLIETFILKEAYEFLERTKGIETVTRLKENARKILKNEEI